MPEREASHQADHDEVMDEIHMPSPSVWPMTLAFGISMVGLGILTDLVFLVFGAVVSIIALAGWAGEMRHE
jgi:hypothetical protein